MTKKKWINLIVILFAFFGFVYIMSTIPFCSDDWAWGASVGAQRLASHFRGYNGRYLGNLLILLLTKSYKNNRNGCRFVFCYLFNL